MPDVVAAHDVHGAAAFAQQLADQVGDEHLGLRVLVQAVREEVGEAARDLVEQGGGEAPEVHAHGGVRGQGLERGSAVQAVRRTRGRLDDVRQLLDEVQLVAYGAAGAAADAAGLGDGVAQAVADHGVARRL